MVGGAPPRIGGRQLVILKLDRVVYSAMFDEILTLKARRLFMVVAVLRGNMVKDGAK
jgi:hypothetical protein